MTPYRVRIDQTIANRWRVTLFYNTTPIKIRYSRWEFIARIHARRWARKHGVVLPDA